METITVWPAWGVEVASDRTRTWVARAAWDDDQVAVVELLAPVVGSATVPALVDDWREKWRLEVVALDPRSPSATLVDPLQGVAVKLADARGMAVAHGKFQDLLTGGRLRVRGHSALDEAARLAQQRRLAGAHAVDRYAPDVDLAPLVAAELAVWALDELAGIEPWGMWT